MCTRELPQGFEGKKRFQISLTTEIQLEPYKFAVAPEQIILNTGSFNGITTLLVQKAAVILYDYIMKYIEHKKLFVKVLLGVKNNLASILAQSK